MKANEPERFKECVSDAINEVYYRSENELWYKGYYRRAAENAEKMVGTYYTGNARKTGSFEITLAKVNKCTISCFIVENYYKSTRRVIN